MLKCSDFENESDVQAGMSHPVHEIKYKSHVSQRFTVIPANKLLKAKGQSTCKFYDLSVLKKIFQCIAFFFHNILQKAHGQLSMMMRICRV